jgi:hypothetical protein
MLKNWSVIKLGLVLGLDPDPDQHQNIADPQQ